MKKLFLVAAALTVMSASAALAVAPSADAPGIRDDPALKRFAGSVLVARNDQAFDEVSLVTGRLAADGRTSPTLRVEGRHTRLAYLGPVGSNSLQLSRNYSNSITAGGGQILFECAAATCGGGAGAGAWIQTRVFPKDKVTGPDDWQSKCTAGYPVTTPFNAPILDVRYFVAKLGGTAERYASVLTYSINSPYDCAGFDKRSAAVVQIIETKAMGDSMVLVKAADMQASLGAQGRVALYGVYFDTNLAVVKDNSAPTLAEIAKLLKDAPRLNVLIVGHTDNTGDFARNIVLSKQRAAAVAQALTAKYGIPAARMRADGVGMLAPAATNDTNDGKAKNRRVELVKLN